MPPLTFHTADLLCSPEEITSFLQSIGGTIQPFEGSERRQFPRHVVSIPALVQQMDDDLNPIGPCVQATAINISTSGVGLIYDSVFTTTFIAIQFRPGERETLTVLAKVLWCRQSGSHYDIGCRLVTV